MTLAVFVRDRTRVALRYRSDEDREHVICFEDGYIATHAVPRALFLRDYQPVNDSTLGSVYQPTVARFLEVINRSTLALSESAANALKEIAEMEEVYVTEEGEIVEAKAKGCLVLSSTEFVFNNVLKLAKLSERARARFVTQALALPKPLARITNDEDPRLLKALNAVLTPAPAGDDNAAAVPEAKPITSSTTKEESRTMSTKAKPKNAKAVTSKSTKPAAKPAAAPAAKGKTPVAKAAAKAVAGKKAVVPARGAPQPRKPGVKRQIFDLLKSGKSGTVEQFCKWTAGSESSVRTALGDLKSDTYGIDGKGINVKNVEGVFKLGR